KDASSASPASASDPRYAKWSVTVAALVPCAVTTVTSTVEPAAPGGETAVIELDERTSYTAGVLPKYTPLTSAKPSPVIVTLVPPLAGPLEGSTAMTSAGGSPAQATPD